MQPSSLSHSLVRGRRRRQQQQQQRPPRQQQVSVKLLLLNVNIKNKLRNYISFLSLFSKEKFRFNSWSFIGSWNTCSSGCCRWHWFLPEETRNLSHYFDQWYSNLNLLILFYFPFSLWKHLQFMIFDSRMDDISFC